MNLFAKPFRGLDLWESCKPHITGHLSAPWPHVILELSGKRIGVALVPKCLSTSLVEVLVQHVNPDLYAFYKDSDAGGVPYVNTFMRRHAFDQSIATSDEEEINSCDATVSFIRDPVSRFVSSWTEKLNCPMYRRFWHELSMIPLNDFPAAVRWLMSQDPLLVDPHIRPQWVGVRSDCGLYPMTDTGIAKFEFDFDVTLPHRNIGIRSRPDVTPFIADVIRSIYSVDAERFTAACSMMGD